MLKIISCALALSVAVLAQALVSYTPPRLVRGGLPALPGPTVIAGGEVMIEATIDQSGALTHPIMLRSTTPFANMVLDAVSGWSFTPARATTDGKEEVVDGSVLIAAVYRPPTSTNGSTIGEPPRNLATASPNAPYAVSMKMPFYPLLARGGLVLLYEVSLDEAGQMIGIRGVGPDSGFDAAAKDALTQWQFRGASVQGRPVPSTAYVIFGFVEPVVSSKP